jgi:hypothetical protein
MPATEEGISSEITFTNTRYENRSCERRFVRLVMAFSSHLSVLNTQVKSSTLEIPDVVSLPDPGGVRMSMGFHSFLQKTHFPSWYPLSNLQIEQQQVLNMLNLKKDHNGKLVWEEKASTVSDTSALHSGDLIPMETRSRYRVCVVGGGIAGLSCCLEIFRECEREGIDVDVVLVEGRSRLGGRICTDRTTFKSTNGTPFAVELGAMWIHGINDNPLAALAKESGVDFVTASEDVTMLQSGMDHVDEGKDELAGQLFDKLLDLAVSCDTRT